MSLVGNELVILRFELKDVGMSSSFAILLRMSFCKKAASQYSHRWDVWQNYTFIYVNFIHVPFRFWTRGLRSLWVSYSYFYLTVLPFYRRLTMIACMKTRIMAQWKWSTAMRGKKFLWKKNTLVCVFVTDFVVCYTPLIGPDCDN